MVSAYSGMGRRGRYSQTMPRKYKSMEECLVRGLSKGSKNFGFPPAEVALQDLINYNK